jgi:hypothetical protein
MKPKWSVSVWPSGAITTAPQPAGPGFVGAQAPSV